MFAKLNSKRSLPEVWRWGKRLPHPRDTFPYFLWGNFYIYELEKMLLNGWHPKEKYEGSWS